MKKKKYVYSLKALISVFILSAFCQFGFVYGSEFGYRPVLGLKYEVENNNPSYKKWCEETFEHGAYVYEGYKAIAFIEFIPEPPETDFWQTPSETHTLGKGDCEDATFLFSDYLSCSQDQDSAEIVWGWVINRHCIAKAHVWIRLVGKDGMEYVAEGFSREWNGIIPMSMLRSTGESREHIFSISCKEFNKLSNSFFYPNIKEWNIQMPVKDKDEIYILEGGYPTYGGNGNWTNNTVFHLGSKDKIGSHIIINKDKEIRNIIRKLYDLFSRRYKGE